MAVEIIEHGKLPEDKRYETRCIKCRTKFSFLASDATYWSAPRNEEGYKLPCPACGKECFVDR